jgi:NAD(P)-dependent dehydrogenase (short-subunit alcohol dehydrogenase family)
MSKAVLVTGSARRLGREIALASAQAGWDVAVHYHGSRREALETASEIRGLGRRSVVVQGDLRKVPDCRRVVREAKRRLGRLDALVNSAADFFPTPCLRVSEREWDRHLDLNLKGSFFCAQEAARVMRRGVILQILDANKAWRRHAAYGISKAGAEAMVAVLARALPPGIRVRAVAPGHVRFQGGRKGIPAGRVALAVVGLLGR